jgi:hypothetical protein
MQNPLKTRLYKCTHYYITYQNTQKKVINIRLLINMINFSNQIN